MSLALTTEALRFHPASEIFELLTGADFHALRDDIAKHGLLTPIWLHPDGSILDGRNRYRACLQAGVQPVFLKWDGDGLAADFVWSLNFARRHLDDGARNIAAGRYDIELQRESRERQGARRDLASGSIEPDVEFGSSAEKAAEKFGVSRETVKRSVTVLQKGTPALVRAVESGKVAVSAAAVVAGELPEDQQNAVVEAGAHAVREVASAIRNGNHRTHYTGNNEWYTPADIIERARRVLGVIDLDPASNPIAQERVKATTFYTKDDDGLTKDWHGRVWLNPPYSQPLIAQFVDKLIAEVQSGRVSAAILLTNNSTDTAWAQKAIRAAARICLTKGRIRFSSPANTSQAPTQGQSFFYFGDEIGAFSAEFMAVGEIVPGSSVQEHQYRKAA